MKKLLIVGAGAQARYIINTVRMLDNVEIVGLVDTFDNAAIWGKKVDGVRVLGNLEFIRDNVSLENLEVITAISDLETKKKIVKGLVSKGYEFGTIIHPSVVIASNVTIGVGCIINAGSVIETGVRIGSHTIIHAGCVVEHDNVLGDFVNLGPRVAIAGRVTIRTGAIVYTGASIIPDCNIGENAIIGAGAVVTSSVAPNQTVVGVPARPIA